ncbi:hypothetical protein M9H77_08519 [Catharanthus roseus]|uniref:Uncharacterized protein n=1 Tax=Catharanthus roseus TaxID=4058 RepID=A0ACC0BY07_CATRO|nr:hypothetical protein M9H77_08519 [Catharanthus roseus]
MCLIFISNIVSYNYKHFRDVGSGKRLTQHFKKSILRVVPLFCCYERLVVVANRHPNNLSLGLLVSPQGLCSSVSSICLLDSSASIAPCGIPNTKFTSDSSIRTKDAQGVSRVVKKRSLKTTRLYEDEVIKLKTLTTRRMVRDSFIRIHVLKLKENLYFTGKPVVQNL